MSIVIDEDGVLLCPQCRYHCLHHERVDVYLRHEDAKDGLHVSAISSERKVGVDEDMSSNPSDRRDGLTIRFSCEDCGATSLMEITQHKGSTLCYFEAME